MPTVISNSELRNEYDKVSRFCHKRPEPVYVTKDGREDLAVMSIEAYEALVRRADLGATFQQGHRDFKVGRITQTDETLSRLREQWCAGLQDAESTSPSTHPRP